MDDIVAFIEARLGEDEAVAAAAFNSQSMWQNNSKTWEAHDTGNVYLPSDPHPFVVGSWDSDLHEIGIHIARHDPARVLRQVAAMRKIVERYELLSKRLDQFRRQALNGTFSERDRFRRHTTGIRCNEARKTVKAFASVWSDHEDYREEWA